MIDKILFAVKAEPFSEIIEVGPGLGALTDDLISVARENGVRLTLIELDKNFAAEWRAKADEMIGAEAGAGASLPAMRVFEGDAMKLDWKEFELLAEDGLREQSSVSNFVEHRDRAKHRTGRRRAA